jgi:PAS domain S-box-containing protein
MSEPSDESFRWQSFFQHVRQPLFLLNRRKRILFVNRAWESCTGLTLAEARGRACRRPPVSAAPDHEASLLGVCTPPADAMRGEVCRVRRRGPDQGRWWELRFFPLMGAEGLLGILGMIEILEAPAAVPFALPEKLMALRDQQRTRYRLENLGTGSPLLARLVEQARLASQTQVPIALVGETGTGKQWLARAIHGASERRQLYFACLDAERLPAQVIGDALFGPRRDQLGLGAVYLRDPACLPREWQARLAETIRPREGPDFPRLYVGFRTEPRELIRAGRLVEEFYCAASTITLHLPPLRERRAELPDFVTLFLERERNFHPHAVQGVSTEALAVLQGYPWPENLRELQEVLRGACQHAKGERIEPADLPFHLRHSAVPPERHLPLDSLLEQVERRLIVLAMKQAHNNQTRAAELLGIWRPRLLRRLEKLGLAAEP